jgi:ligand-binding sensor domain-containing protein
VNISRKDGLSDSNVKAICVDHFGYVWIGTDHGLNRYDGFETITYYHDINDNSTLSNNKISRIYEDREGEIWVITPNGVNFFNRQSGVFQRILMGFSRIAYESEAEIWFIQSNRIIYIYDKASQIITQHAIQFDGEELSADQFSNPQVCDFDERYLLLSIWNRGLYLLEKNNKMLIPYFNLPIENCTGLFVLNGNIWISSYFSGIYKINIENDSIVHYTANNSAICNSIILDFKKSSDTNSIWIATDGSGIQEFNEDFELLNHYEAGSGVNKPLPDNSIQTLYFGDEGNVWAGSVRSGAVLLYPDFIEYFPNKDNSPAGPSNKVILRGFEDREGNIWLGTDGGGLNRFTPSNYIFKQYLNKSAAKITGAIPFSKDKILLSSYMGQLFFFDTKKLIYSTAHNHPLFREIEIRKNYRLFKDSKKNIWIWDNRLWKINIEKNSAELISKDLYPDLFSQISASFHCVFEDTIENKLWFGARGGFYAFDFDKNKITNLVVLNKVRDMYGSDVYSIIVGKDSKIIF